MRARSPWEMQLEQGALNQDIGMHLATRLGDAYGAKPLGFAVSAFFSRFNPDNINVDLTYDPGNRGKPYPKLLRTVGGVIKITGSVDASGEHIEPIDAEAMLAYDAIPFNGGNYHYPLAETAREVRHDLPSVIVMTHHPLVDAPGQITRGERMSVLGAERIRALHADLEHLKPKFNTELQARIDLVIKVGETGISLLEGRNPSIELAAAQDPVSV